jgi:hypothetical protein
MAFSLRWRRPLLGADGTLASQWPKGVGYANICWSLLRRLCVNRYGCGDHNPADDSVSLHSKTTCDRTCGATFYHKQVLQRCKRDERKRHFECKLEADQRASLALRVCRNYSIVAFIVVIFRTQTMAVEVKQQNCGRDRKIKRVSPLPELRS